MFNNAREQIIYTAQQLTAYSQIESGQYVTYILGEKGSGKSTFVDYYAKEKIDLEHDASKIPNIYLYKEENSDELIKHDPQYYFKCHITIPNKIIFIDDAGELDKNVFQNYIQPLIEDKNCKQVIVLADKDKPFELLPMPQPLIWVRPENW